MGIDIQLGKPREKVTEHQQCKYYPVTDELNVAVGAPSGGAKEENGPDTDNNPQHVVDEGTLLVESCQVMALLEIEVVHDTGPVTGSELQYNESQYQCHLCCREGNGDRLDDIPDHFFFGIPVSIGLAVSVDQPIQPSLKIPISSRP